MPDKIAFAGLYRQLGELKGTGRYITEGEVGPETWKAILSAVMADPKYVVEGWFAGVHIIPGDVPEGKIWPRDLKD